jgi:hypothetical protein
MLGGVTRMTSEQTASLHMRSLQQEVFHSLIGRHPLRGLSSSDSVVDQPLTGLL